MSDWLTEGVSARWTWGRPDPVIHLLVSDAGNRMWCSGGAGRPEVHMADETQNGRRRLCRECKALAQEAVEEGTLDAGDLEGWHLTPLTLATADVTGSAPRQRQ